MAAKVMKTLWDESSELANESLTPHSILGDDYVTDDNDALDNLKENLNAGIDDDSITDEDTAIENEDCGCKGK